jgi:hypothetical protein
MAKPKQQEGQQPQEGEVKDKESTPGAGDAATTDPQSQVPAEKENTQVAVRSVADMMEEDAGAGFEGADRDAYAIPFITILQSGSPQVKRSDGAYIKGAEEGMLFNSVTQEVQSGEDGQGLLVVPCYFTRRFTRWGARKLGGGLKGEYSPSDPILARCRGEGGSEVGFGGRLLPDDKGEFHADTSDVLNDTRTHYVLVLRKADGTLATTLEEAASFSPAVTSVTSTQIRKSRLWMSKMNDLKLRRRDGSIFTPPMFSHAYRLTTVPEKNDQGSWYGWKIDLVGQVTNPDIYMGGKQFRDAVKAGEVKTQPLTEEAISGASDRRGGPTPKSGAGGVGEDDIPF